MALYNRYDRCALRIEALLNMIRRLAILELLNFRWSSELHAPPKACRGSYI